MSGSGTSGTRSRAQREFVAEAEEILDALRADLLELDVQREGGAVDPEHLNRLFRAAHSLKGLAAMSGFDSVAALAHHLEDVLDGLRMGRIRSDSPALALLDEAAALCAALIGGDPADAPDEDVTQLVGRIEAAVAVCDAPPADDPLHSLDIDASLLRALTEYEEHRLRENLRDGRRIVLVDTCLEILDFEDGLEALGGAIREVGEVISTLPSPAESPEAAIRFSLLAGIREPLDAFGARLAAHDATVQELARDAGGAAPVGRADAAGARPATPHADAAVAAVPAPQAAATGAQASRGEAPSGASLRSVGESVRVEIRKLDALMTQLGELVVERAAIAALAQRLQRDPATRAAGAEVARVHKQLERKLELLQAGVLDVRMVPLRQVFEKLSRLARRLERDLDKQVHLDFRGADTELDKRIVEELIDPLVHVVRNAFDHAIESADERAAAGKPAQGSIRIEASQRGNHVEVAIHDDGRGIDLARLRERAVRAGILTQEQQPGQRELLALVFEPGLSTRDTVSETSGRGVGMDVVRTNLASVGGLVDVRTRAGAGSTVTLTVPITLAILRVLEVGVGEQRFAVPLAAVVETLLLDGAAIHASEGAEWIDLRGEPLPLRRLADEFGIATDEAAGGYVVVLGVGELRLGLVVERLDAERDAVVKPMRGPLPRVPGIAGGTETGDGAALLVLDVAGLVEGAVRRRDAA